MTNLATTNTISKRKLNSHHSPPEEREAQEEEQEEEQEEGQREEGEGQEQLEDGDEGEEEDEDKGGNLDHANNSKYSYKTPPITNNYFFLKNMIQISSMTPVVIKQFNKKEHYEKQALAFKLVDELDLPGVVRVVEYIPERLILTFMK